MKNMRKVYKSLIILTVVVLSMLLAGCEDDGGGKCSFWKKKGLVLMSV